MKAKGYLRMANKNKLPHYSENHNQDFKCKCGAIFCGVKNCSTWQQTDFGSDNEELPKKKCFQCDKKVI